MAPSIAMDYGPCFAVSDGFYRCIKHGVYEIGVRSGPNGPTYDQAVDVIDDRGKIDFFLSDVRHR